MLHEGAHGRYLQAQKRPIQNLFRAQLAIVSCSKEVRLNYTDSQTADTHITNLGLQNKTTLR